MPKLSDKWTVGESYEHFMGRWSRLLASRFVSWLPARPNAHWLDVGCGTGALGDAICATAQPASVVGCDLSQPLVLVSRRGAVPPQLREAEPGSVLMATCAAAERLADARATLGDEQVLVLGHHRVDLAALKQTFVDRGWTSILSEGGPHLLRDLLAEGVVDELDLTVVPRVLGGLHPRITDGAPLDVPLEPALLLEDGGTLLGRWLTRVS